MEGTLLISILFDVRSGRFCVAHPEFLGGQVFPCGGGGGGLTVVVFGCGLFADDLDVTDGYLLTKDANAGTGCCLGVGVPGAVGLHEKIQGVFA